MVILSLKESRLYSIEYNYDEKKIVSYTGKVSKINY